MVYILHVLDFNCICFVPICNFFVPQYNHFGISYFIKFAIFLQMDGWKHLFFQKFCTLLQCYSKWLVKYAFIHCSTGVQNNCKKTLVKCRKTQNFYKLIAKVQRNFPQWFWRISFEIFVKHITIKSNGCVKWQLEQRHLKPS